MRKQKIATKPAPAAVAAPPQTTAWWPMLVLLGLTILAYLPAMRGPFLFDDLTLPILNGEASPPAFYLRRVVRAIFNLSVLVDYRTWGLNPAPFHWMNLFLHLVNGALTYLILRAFKVTHWLCVFALGLFLLHPLQTEAVSYIASRSEGLSVLFSYAALAVFVCRDRETPITWPQVVEIVVFMGLAVLSKESAVAMVGVFLLIDLLEGGFKRWLRNWHLYAPLAAGGAFATAMIIRIVAGEGTAGFQMKGVNPIDYLWTQFQVIPLYIRLYFFPWGQNLDHGFPLAKAPVDFFSWLGLTAIAGVLYFAWYERSRLPLLFLGLATFLILLSPTSSIVPIADNLVERRLYLPSIGLLLAVVSLLSGIRWKFSSAAALATVLFVLTGLTAARNQIYTSTTAMWEDSLQGNSQNARAHFQLGYAYYVGGKCAEANQEFAQAAALSKPTYELLVDWAHSLECSGDPNSAIQKLNDAIALKNDSHAWTTMGMIYGKNNKPVEALQALNKALSLNPQDANALAFRGNVLFVSGKINEAAADFQAALRINPSNSVASQGLASARIAQKSVK